MSRDRVAVLREWVSWRRWDLFKWRVDTVWAVRRWWSTDRPVYWIRGRWEWGWLGDGWNRFAFGKVAFWFDSGPSPAARLRRRLRR